MTAALHARNDDGGVLSIELDGRVLSALAPIVVEVDRRTIARWAEPTAIDDPDGAGLSGTLDGTTVHAAWSARRVAGQPVWECALELRNDGDAPVTVSRMDPVALELTGERWDVLSFRSAWGDEFRPVHTHSGHDLVLDSRSGRSSHGTVPWIGFERRSDQTAGQAVTVSPAWSGNWHIHALSRGHVTAGISPWQFAVELQPGETVTAPSVVLALAADLDAASVAVQRAVADDWLPRTPFTDSLPVEWNHWWPYEDAEVTEGVIAENAAVAAELGIEIATVDAGWFGAADAASDWQEQRGDWSSVNTERFPSGLAALGDSIRAAGVLPGMWIEAEAVGRSSRLRTERPGLLARAVDGRRPDPSYRLMTVSLDPDDPGFLGYVCLGSPEGREQVLESMSRLITETGARWIKLDFNIDPDAGCTRTDHGHGALDGLFRHYEGLYAVLDELRARHPQIVLESCSSGGLRIDLGLARHVHAFFLSDPDYTEHHLEVVHGVRHLLPPVGVLHWSWSQWRGDYPASQLDWSALSPAGFDRMLRAAMVHRFGVSLRLVELRPELLERLREHVRLFHEAVAPFVRDGVLLPLTATPERGGLGERAPALQLSDPSDRHLLAAFVLDGGDRPASIRPRGIDRAATYRTTDLGTGETLILSGAELADSGAPLGGVPETVSWLLLVEPAAPAA